MTTEDAVAIDEATQMNYRVWKKNARHLYDYIQTHSLTWPSLTLQWFPDVEKADGITKTRLLLGTSTSGLGDDTLTLLHVPYYSHPKAKLDLTKFDSIKEEFVTPAPRDSTVMSTQQKITHLGDVNRARYMPQNPDLVATITGTGDVSVFDRTKHASHAGRYQCEIELHHHTDDGFGLCWNATKEGKLASCAADGKLAIWDLGRWRKSSPLRPVQSYSEDTGLNDVQYLPVHDSVLGYVGEQGVLRVMDTRGDEKVKLTRESKTGINCMSFNPQNDYCIATGDGDGTVELWDIRTRSSFSSFKAHEKDITCIQWNWQSGGVLATGSNDRLVKVWDFSLESPLRFVHGGHMAEVTDLGWNLEDSGMVASVGYDNSVQVWKPAAALL